MSPSKMAIPTKGLFALLRRGFTTTTTVSSSTSNPTLRCTNKIPGQYKHMVVQETQKALTEYFHATKCVPFYFAEQIAKNSLFCLSKLIRKVRFSVPTFPPSIRSVLRYQAINEFEFFLESIGIDYRDIARYLPRDKLFLSDGGGVVFNAAVALSQFGFPWNTLGILYSHQVSIFSRSAGELAASLCEIREFCGFHNLTLVGVCLAFPNLLAGEGDLGGEFEALFEDLKRVFREFDNRSLVEGNVDHWYEVCCVIRVFYELGCDKGTLGEFMCRGDKVLLECPKQVLEDKSNYFFKFGVGKHRVGSLLLRYPELLGLDLERPVISVSGLLEHFGLDAEELWYLSKKYPHVFGRNKMANLPGVMRALDLHVWFIDKIESLGCQLLVTYVMDRPDQDLDEKFQDGLKKIESTRCGSYRMSKLNLLTSLGFGENARTLHVVRGLHATSSGVQERFDHLLSLNIKYSEVCLMMRMAPAICCISTELVEKKLDYLCKERGSSIKYLGCFPRFLLFDLENRIKPRHRFCVWLRQTGLYTKNYSVKSIIDASEKRFIARVVKIHRAAPKLYLECYLSKS